MIIAGFGLTDRYGSLSPACLWGDPFTHGQVTHISSPTLNESSYASFPGSCFLRARQVSQPAEGGGGSVTRSPGKGQDIHVRPNPHPRARAPTSPGLISAPPASTPSAK